MKQTLKPTVNLFHGIRMYSNREKIVRSNLLLEACPQRSPSAQPSSEIFSIKLLIFFFLSFRYQILLKSFSRPHAFRGIRKSGSEPLIFPTSVCFSPAAGYMAKSIIDLYFELPDINTTSRYGLDIKMTTMTHSI